MSHQVLDGNQQIKWAYSIGDGSSGDPYRLTAMPYIDTLIDRGIVFTHSDRHVLANNAVTYYMLVTPSSGHIELLGLDITTTAAPILLDIREACIVSENGESAGIANLNRKSSTSSSCSLYEDPTVTDTGTKLAETVISGDRTGGGLGGISWPRIVLKNSEKYLIKLQNTSGGSATLGIQITFGED